MDKKLVKQELPKLSILEFLDKMNRSEVRKRLVPQELRWGWPAVSIKKNGEICITLFFYNIQRIADKKQCYLFPIVYTMSALWKSGKIVDFKCLPYDKNYYKQIDFCKPCDIFPHKAIAGFDAKKYKETRKRLFELYDELISCIDAKQDFKNENEFKELLSLMMEPGHYPIYQAAAPKFFSYYCNPTD